MTPSLQTPFTKATHFFKTIIMGTCVSKLAFFLRRCRILYDLHSTAYRRVTQDPGLPRVDPSIPYWAIPPSNIARCGAESERIPEEADIVIIGSGITGASVAHSLLRHLGEGESKVKIVMLEAREVCSGATARNGGHITPPWYHDYTELVTKHGKNQAHKIINFWLSHIPELLSLAETEGLLHDSQCRLVDTFDVYADPTLFDAAFKNYNAYMKELAPFNDTSRIFCAKEQFEALQLNSTKISGIIGTIAGAIHPYRLVTGVLSNLLKMHTNFELFAFTPCTSITSSPSAYIVSTPKGTITARHVVHATNAWTSHLLPEFREKVVPFCGQMSSQRPGTELGHGFIPGAPSTVSPDPMNWQGSRSFIFYNDDNELHYNYLTQQLPCAQPSSSPYPSPHGELMLGGALAIIHDVLMRQMGNSDNTKTVPELDTYLSGVLPSYWGKHWGDESPSTPEDNKTGWNKGRIKAMWTGLIGWSVDGCPWVGRIPPEIIGREVNAPNNGAVLTRPGEWICAGYTGEGMVNAWRCGDAVSQMILGKSDYQAWFPESFAVSLQRHKRTKFGDLLDVFM